MFVCYFLLIAVSYLAAILIPNKHTTRMTIDRKWVEVRYNGKIIQEFKADNFNAVWHHSDINTTFIVGENEIECYKERCEWN